MWGPLNEAKNFTFLAPIDGDVNISLMGNDIDGLYETLQPVDPWSLVQPRLIPNSC